MQSVQAAEKMESAVEQQLNVAVQEINQGHYQQALVVMQGVLKLEPNNLKATSGIGNIYAVLHQYDNAIAYLEKSLKLDPRDLTSLYGLGACYMDLQQHEKAIPYLERLVRLRPNDLKPLQTLAVAYVRRSVRYGEQGQSQKARTALQSAITLFRRTGDTNRVKELTIALKQIPQQAERSPAQATIRQLNPPTEQPNQSNQPSNPQPPSTSQPSGRPVGSGAIWKAPDESGIEGDVSQTR